MQNTSEIGDEEIDFQNPDLQNKSKSQRGSLQKLILTDRQSETTERLNIEQIKERYLKL